MDPEFLILSKDPGDPGSQHFYLLRDLRDPGSQHFDLARDPEDPISQLNTDICHEILKILYPKIMISRWILQILDSKILICRWILRILDLKIMIYRGILWILDPDFLPRHMSGCPSIRTCPRGGVFPSLWRSSPWGC